MTLLNSQYVKPGKFIKIPSLDRAFIPFFIHCTFAMKKKKTTVLSTSVINVAIKEFFSQLTLHC